MKHKAGDITIEESPSEGLCVIQLITKRWTSNGGYRYLNVRWGFQDTAGKMIIAPAFLGAFSFREGLAVVIDTIPQDDRVTGLKIGFIDHSGHYKIPPIYRYANDFSEGKAAVSKVTRK